MKEEGKFYHIGEVSKITGIAEHILRYWEKEFSYLKPIRDQKGHRIYTEKEIEKINHIKFLIYNEGYKIQGVKKKLRGENKKENRKKETEIKFLKKILKELYGVEKCLQ